jgi:[protein-PII] uridylyltransferase
LTDEADAAGTALFVQTPQDWFSFAIATAILDELGLNIVDARVVTLANGQSVSAYIILEESGNHVADERRRGEIRSRMLNALGTPASANIEVTRRAPRQVRLFDTPVHVTFAMDARNRHTVVELVAGDRPGLLSDVAKVLREMRVYIRTAKILTVGERAEDVFYVTDENEKPLDQEACEALDAALTSALKAAA